MAKIRTSNGFGNDNISSYFLKFALAIISKLLTVLFNRSINQCKFPASWKIARVTPIFKDGDKSVKEKYRPISSYLSFPGFARKWYKTNIKST